jgi:hypothetical protein
MDIDTNSYIPVNNIKVQCIYTDTSSNIITSIYDDISFNNGNILSNEELTSFINNKRKYNDEKYYIMNIGMFKYNEDLYNEELDTYDENNSKIQIIPINEKKKGGCNIYIKY